MDHKSTLDELLQRLRTVQRELEQEIERLLAEKRRQFRYNFLRGKVVFEHSLKRLQRKQRMVSWRYLWNAPFSFILSAPVIYGMIVPLVLLDLTITCYQHICFRIYRIPRICRGDYIVIDRHHLAYLNMIQKFNCVYCEYANGLIAYAREIVARTEQFWCPIKHAKKVKGAHERALKFFDYGDAQAWRDQLKHIRQDWSDTDSSDK